MREALRLMEKRDQIKAEVRKKIAVGMESLRQGKVIDGDAFFTQMDAELDADIRAEEEQAERARIAGA